MAGRVLRNGVLADSKPPRPLDSPPLWVALRPTRVPLRRAAPWVVARRGSQIGPTPRVIIGWDRI
jgi:hypothetical protein